MQIGDIVYMDKLTEHVKFIIKYISENTAMISAIDYRLILDVSLTDLKYISSSKLNEDILNTSCNNLEPHIIISNLSLPKILHIDSEKIYLNDSLKQYKAMGVNVFGFIIKESKQPSSISCLLKKFNPNILVITGHDSLYKNKKSSKNLDDYRNSKYFIESVKIARMYNSNLNDLVIIAGGCKSFHEGLLEAGANFASSPERILINVLDPVNIACLIAKTPSNEYLDINDLYKTLNLDIGSFDGVKTQGQKRIK